MTNEHAKNLMGVQREATMKGDAWAANIARNAAAEIMRLATELAEAKRIPHMDSLNPVLLAKSLEAVNAINTRLEAELAAARAKVERGDRFKQWVTATLGHYDGWKGLVSMSRRVADWHADDAAQHGEGGNDGE